MHTDAEVRDTVIGRTRRARHSSGDKRPRADGNSGTRSRRRTSRPHTSTSSGLQCFQTYQTATGG